MKRIIYVKLVVALSLIIMAVNSYADTLSEMATADSRVTFKIVDEAGMPVELAHIGVGYIVLSWGIQNKTFDVKGYSDATGHFSSSANASKKIGFTVKREGYYDSVGQFEYKKITDEKWEPWNPEVKVVLRKIENPVPMYARDTKKSNLIMPVAGKDVGFDLINYDWVTPYGKGSQSDLQFRLEGSYINSNNYDITLTITFIGHYNGIQLVQEDISQGSVFKLPRFAPDNGYEQKIVKHIKWSDKHTDRVIPNERRAIESNFVDNNSYFIRVRSQESNGKLLRAMYGKIQGDIKVYPKSTGSAMIIFKYYLNPDYTRNLEYGRNIFDNLPSTERVGLE